MAQRDEVVFEGAGGRRIPREAAAGAGGLRAQPAVQRPIGSWRGLHTTEND